VYCFLYSVWVYETPFSRFYIKLGELCVVKTPGLFGEESPSCASSTQNKSFFSPSLSQDVWEDCWSMSAKLFPQSGYNWGFWSSLNRLFYTLVHHFLWAFGAPISGGNTLLPTVFLGPATNVFRPGGFPHLYEKLRRGCPQIYTTPDCLYTHRRVGCITH